MLQVKICLNLLFKLTQNLLKTNIRVNIFQILTFDVSMITNLLTNALLNLFKDSLTLIGLLFVMFYQNWKLSLIAIIMIPLASAMADLLEKESVK